MTRRCSGWVAFGLALVAAAATLIATRHGPQVTADSITYISAARNLADGDGIVDFTGQPLTAFPPGFAAILAFGDFFGIGAEDSARIVNALAYAAIVLLAFVLLRRHVDTRWIVYGATVLVAISPPLLAVADRVWSEPLFVALALVFLLALERTIDSPRRTAAPIVVCAVLVWPAFLVRYAAIALVAAGALALTIDAIRRGSRSAVWRPVLFCATALVVPIGWILRNWATGEDLMGPRVANDLSLTRVGWTAVRHVAGLMFVPSAPVAIRAMFVGTVLAAAALLVALIARRVGDGVRDRPVPSMVPLVSFVVVYVVFSAVSHRIAGSSLDSRILVPIHVPAVILGARGCDELVSRLTNAPRWGVKALAAISTAWLLLIAARFIDLVDKYGSATTTPRELSGQTLEGRVAALDQRALVVTNDPWRLAYGSGREPIHLSPGRLIPALSHRPIPLGDVIEAVECAATPVFLVWFSTRETPHLLSPRELGQRVRLVRTADTDRGALYELRSRTEAEATGRGCG